jgi:16S rRNA processing protein RimM
MGVASGFVFVGRVHSPQGLKGEIFISIFSGEAAWAEQWQQLFISGENENQPTREFPILWTREHRKQGRWGFVVSAEGVNSRGLSESLKGSKVYIPTALLTTQEGETPYLREVLGFQVIDQTRGAVGEVVGFSGNALQDILVVRSKQGDVEVPFVEPLLIKIEKSQRQLLMDIPQGLVAGEEL